MSDTASLKEALPRGRSVAKKIHKDLTICYQEKSNSFILIMWHILEAQLMFDKLEVA